MDCITFTDDGTEDELRGRLMAPALNLEQDLYIGGSLKTGRIMVKDEDVCLHCGLCAERCPTGAWDMRKFLLDMTAGRPCLPGPVRAILTAEDAMNRATSCRSKRAYPRARPTAATACADQRLSPEAGTWTD